MSAAVITPTRRSLASRLWRWLLIAWTEFDIHCTEEWIDDCARDGVLTSAQLEGCHWRLQELRVQLAVLRPS